jgi:hypothetical protein
MLPVNGDVITLVPRIDNVVVKASNLMSVTESGIDLFEFLGPLRTEMSTRLG